jgi:hypothetical protein
MIYPGRGKTFAKESSLSEAKAENIRSILGSFFVVTFPTPSYTTSW